jgi:1-acyl-sn-glycerol-3-phosphate acyltransferase
LLTRDPDTVVAAWAFLRRWFTWLLRWAWAFTVHDQDRVPAGPAIVVANHLSNLDPILLGYALPRPGAVMGKQEVFNLPVVGWILNRIGSFPVTRGAQDEGAMATAKAVIQAGWPLVLFPEGTRNRNARWGANRIRSGAARIALETQAPIVPAALIGPQAIFPPGARWPRRTPVEVRFGPPLLPETYLPPADWPVEAQLAHITTQIVEAVGALLPDDLKALPAEPTEGSAESVQ